jgi:hypothetical protein
LRGDECDNSDCETCSHELRQRCAVEKLDSREVEHDRNEGRGYPNLLFTRFDKFGHMPFLGGSG